MPVGLGRLGPTKEDNEAMGEMGKRGTVNSSDRRCTCIVFALDTSCEPHPHKHVPGKDNPRVAFMYQRHTRLRQQGFLSLKEMCQKFGISRQKVYALRRSKKLRACRYDDVGRSMYKLPEGERLTP